MAVNLNFERKLSRKGFRYIVGLDEVGRGPLAGPVLACAVAIRLRKGSKLGPLKYLNDSKKLSAAQRERFYELLVNHPDIEWQIGRVSERVIDKINILEATKLAMEKAVAKLKTKPDFLVLDGIIKLNLSLPQEAVIKADEKIFSCMAAGVIAKVTRDKIMGEYHKKYPKYRFCDHVGYGTKLHRDLIKKYGPCKIHRKSFRLY